jgi:stearoyl-CoA desaturase (delta-9 desaturase)
MSASVVDAHYPRAASATARREGGGSRPMALVYLGLHLALAGLFWTGLSLAEVFFALLLVQARGLCLSAGYHRLLAHRSARTTRLFQFLLAAGACTALRGGPLYWTALHRHHHCHPDTEEDVHTAAKGFWWCYGGWLISGQFPVTDYNRVRDLARCPELVWLNRWWLLPSLPLAGLVVLIGGWQALVTVFCLSSVLLLHTMALFDALAHRTGWQRYQTGDQSRNSFWMALLTNGEGWHNNHHHFPASARQGFFWWELDSTYVFLVVLSWLGLVWDLKKMPESMLRRNLIVPDRECG